MWADVRAFSLMIDPALKSIIGWNADGDAVVVLNIAEFVRVALPRYFRAKQVGDQSPAL